MENVFIKVRRDGWDPDRVRRVYKVRFTGRTVCGYEVLVPDDQGQLTAVDACECLGCEARPCMHCAKLSDDVGPYTPDLWLCGACYSAHDRAQMARAPGGRGF